MKFNFISAPTSVDSLPELAGNGGDNALFGSIRGKLLFFLEQLQQLQPIGDRDLDRRLEVLTSTAESHIQLLESRKAEAWQEVLLSSILAKRVLDGKGPVAIDTGE